jgi:hypothetical protein
MSAHVALDVSQPGKSGAGKRISTTDFISLLARFSPPAQRLLSPS